MSLWTPSDTTTAIWLDAADASTLFDATTGGSLVAADGTIARWNDKSGAGINVIQSSSTLRPVRKTAVQNGLDVVRLDGSNDILTFGSSTLFRNVSYAAIYVVRKINVSPVVNPPWIVGVETATSGFLRAALDLNRGNTTKYGSGGRRLDGDSFQSVQSSASYGTAGFEVQCAEFLYSVATLRNVINGTIDGSTTSFQTSGSTSNSNSAQLNVGGNPYGNVFFGGDIGEVIISYISADREKLEGYLAWKWGLQNSLPVGHPYKNAAPTKASPIQIFAAAHNAVRGAL